MNNHVTKMSLPTGSMSPAVHIVCLLDYIAPATISLTEPPAIHLVFGYRTFNIYTERKHDTRSMAYVGVL